MFLSRVISFVSLRGSLDLQIVFVRELSFGTLGGSQARKKDTQKGAELFIKVAPRLESKIVRACLVSLVLVIDAYFSSSLQEAFDIIESGGS